MSTAHCHFLIKETAEGFASALFEEVMQDNDRFKAWQMLCPGKATEEIRKEYVRVAWPKLLEQARATLAKMLHGPYDECLKKQIHQALILDNSLAHGRKQGKSLLKRAH